MAKKYQYHRSNCDTKVRAQITFGSTTITLVGQHAFEWSIVKELQKEIIVMTFKNREQAKQEFDKYKPFKKK